MAATSPYSGNDYTAVSNFRPYELPVNDIFKALVAQNEFWEIGARRVKAVYENALNLDLTSDANKEYKKKFMEEADKQLTRLSSMDLSDPSIQRQGFSIFKPLLNDEAVMIDNQLTKTLKNIYTDANMYRRKKLSSTGPEGEGYTDRNLAYSLDGFENFNSATPRDPDLLKDMYRKLGQRKYTPYYNPTQEYASIMKLCKGSGGQTQDVASNYMYFDSFSKSGANSSETSNCFMMGLSENAKAQMGIDGWAYYKQNPALLVEDHRAFALGRQEAQLKGIQGKIAGIKAGGVDVSEKAKLKELEDMLPAVQQEYSNREKEYNNMVGGDAMNYVMQNFQTLAKGVYLSKNYAALGEAFKSDETSRKLTANAAGIAQFNAIERAYAAERQNDYAKEQIMLRAALSRKLKQEAGEIPLDQVGTFTPPVTEGTDTGQTYGEDDFNKEWGAAFKTYSDSYQTLGSYILSTDPNLNRKAFTHEFILNFANEQGKKPREKQDPQFRELMDAYSAAKDNFSSMDVRKKSVNNIIEDEFRRSSDFTKLQNKTLKLSDGTTIRYSDLHNLPAQTSRQFLGSAGPGGGGGTVSDVVTSYTVNGRKYDQTSDDFYKIQQAMYSISEQQKNMQSRRDELYRKQYYEAQKLMTPRLDPSKNANVDMRIKAALGVSGGHNEKGGYKLLGHDLTGKDLIVVPLDAEGNEMKPDLVRAKSYSTGVEAMKIGTRINGVVIKDVLQPIANLPTEQQQSSISQLRDFQVLMESQLRNKGSYYTSEMLKNNDGTTYPYPNFSFKTPQGKNVKVKAVIANGQVKLVPSVQLQDGSWDNNYPSFTSPEDLILRFRTQ